MLSSEAIKFSDTHGVWLWRSSWHLSILCKTSPSHSHTAGKFPAHESPSCVVWYKLPPDGALVCRFWSRSDEHSKTLQCNLMIVGRGLLHALLYVTSWCVVFLDSAILSRGWSNDRGFDLCAECHPELGCEGLRCSQWLGCRCHYYSGYQGNTCRLDGNASFSCDTPCRLMILGGDYGNTSPLHIPYHCYRGMPAPGFCPSYCRRKPVLGKCPQIDWLPGQASPRPERTWWSWVWPASCQAVSSPPSAPRPVGVGSGTSPCRPSPGEGFPGRRKAQEDAESRAGTTPTRGPSLGERGLADTGSPNPSWCGDSGPWELSLKPQARSERDPLLHQGRKFCSNWKQSKARRLLAKEAWPKVQEDPAGESRRLRRSSLRTSVLPLGSPRL